MRQLKLNGKQENVNNSPGCISSNDIRQGARLWEAIIGTFLHQKVGKWLSTFCKWAYKTVVKAGSQSGHLKSLR